MSKIYTKTGDRGQTSLLDGTRVPKNHIRVETYGTIDELNATIGTIVAEMQKSKVKSELINIQNDLFELGSFLADPAMNHEPRTMNYFENRVQHFEKLIDEMTEKLPLLTNFILPGGSTSGSFLHVARTIARRAERRIIELSQTESVDGLVIRYFNRLSDLLFTMSRFMNFKEKKKDIIWMKR